MKHRRNNLPCRARTRHLFLGAALIIAFASCGNILQKPADGSKYARVSVSVGGGQARTVFAEPVSLDELGFVLEGEGGAGVFSKTWESYAAMKAEEVFFIEIGKWKFTLSVQDAKGTLFYTSELETEIISGDNALNFILQEADGTGAARVTLVFPTGCGVDKINAGLFNTDGQTPVKGFEMEPLALSGNTATYQKENIPSGNYILRFRFLNAAGEEIFLGVMETIQIKSGRVSSKELKIEKLATKNFKYGDYGFVTMLKSSGGESIVNAIETVPKNMPATAFYWSVESDTITGLSIDEEGFLKTDDTITDYPATAKVTATPKSGGEKIECVVLVDDDLSLKKAELQRLCTLKSIDYATITEFEVPYGYTELADEGWSSGVFRDHSNIEKVTLPESLEKIGQCSFRSCVSLKTVKCAGLEDGVLPKKLNEIGTQAFFGCISLEKITIPGGVETIGELTGYSSGVFDNCIGLKEIIIEDGVKTIGKYAFRGSYYDSSISAMRYNTAITKISIPKSVENIGEQAFYQMQYRTNSADIPNAPEVELIFTESEYPASEMTIGEDSFYLCHGLRNLTIPGNVTTIDKNAFYGCQNLQKVTMGDGVKTIGEYAFYNLYSISELYIPKSVESIGYSAFINMQYRSNTEDIPNAPETKLVFTESENPAAEMIIGNYAFQNCHGLRSVTLPSNLKSLGTSLDSGGSFGYCRNLKEVKFEENSVCETIGYGSFDDCDNLESITLPRTKDGIETKIGNYAFQNLKKVTSLTIPGNVVEIGDAAFNGYEKLAELNLEEGIETIKQYAFANILCHYPIRTIVIPSTVTSIGSNAFYNFSSYCSPTDPFTYVFKSTTPISISSAIRSDNSDTLKIFVPKEAIYAYHEHSSWSYFKDNNNFGVEGKNTFLLKIHYSNTGWFDTNRDGVKDTDERDYCYFTIEPGATDGATFDPELLPKPTKTDSTTPGVIEWLDSSYNTLKQIENPRRGGVTTVLYAKIVSGISLDSIGGDIFISYDRAERSLIAPIGYTSYKWFIDGEEKSETSRMLDISGLATGVYRILVFTEDASGKRYSASYNLIWEAN